MKSPSSNSVVKEVLEPVRVEELSVTVTVPVLVVSPLFAAPTSFQYSIFNLLPSISVAVLSSHICTAFKVSEEPWSYSKNPELLAPIPEKLC